MRIWKSPSKKNVAMLYSVYVLLREVGLLDHSIPCKDNQTVEYVLEYLIELIKENTIQ